VWKLTHPLSAIGFPVARGELRKLTLSFVTPTHLKEGTRALVRIFQRNDNRITTGSVSLDVTFGGSAAQLARARRHGKRKEMA
jgi:hypothetical protein